MTGSHCRFDFFFSYYQCIQWLVCAHEGKAKPGEYPQTWEIRGKQSFSSTHCNGRIEDAEEMCSCQSSGLDSPPSEASSLRFDGSYSERRPV